MKLLITALFASAAALAPSGEALNRRSAFAKFAGGAAAVVAAAPLAANAVSFSYTGKPNEEVPKFAPKEKWNTLYPDKKLLLEKKSPVDRMDLSAIGNYATYKKTYPGLTTAIGATKK